MSDPRFKPRAYTTEPNAFGKAASLGWITPVTEAEDDLCRAAQLQHTYAVRINRRLRDIHKTVRDYSQMTGIGYDRLAKVLRGDAIMRLEDIAQAERLLGDILDTCDKGR
ncbi:hypothetical protein [Cryobacterium aureum]|uniref:hypothetical protein n=1 Tax=Cryobacterium aureum TaxID=995037 RepID=UPI000CF52C79|nr:hypothetical protein [Cryobacterium aureum]